MNSIRYNLHVQCAVIGDNWLSSFVAYGEGDGEERKKGGEEIHWLFVNTGGYGD